MRASPPRTPRSTKRGRVIVMRHLDVGVHGEPGTRSCVPPGPSPSGVSPVRYSCSVSARMVLRDPLLSAWRPIESCSNGELVWAFCTMVDTFTCGTIATQATMSVAAAMTAGTAPRRRAIPNIAPRTVVAMRTSAPPLEPVSAMAARITRAARPPDQAAARVLHGAQYQQRADEVVGGQVGVAQSERGPHAVPGRLAGQHRYVPGNANDHQGSPERGTDRPGPGN